jgi:hypothetical protein
MTDYKNILSDFQKKTCSVQIQLGDKSCHDTKGNLLSVSALEDKGYKVTGKVVLWPKDGQLSSAEFIRIREGSLNKVTNNYAHALVHSNTQPLRAVTQKIRTPSLQGSPWT